MEYGQSSSNGVEMESCCGVAISARSKTSQLFLPLAERCVAIALLVSEELQELLTFNDLKIEAA